MDEGLGMKDEGLIVHFLRMDEGLIVPPFIGICNPDAFKIGICNPMTSQSYV